MFKAPDWLNISIFIKLALISLTALIVSFFLLSLEVSQPLKVTPAEFTISSQRIVDSIDHAVETLGLTEDTVRNAILLSEVDPIGNVQVSDNEWSIIYDSTKNVSQQGSNDTHYKLTRDETVRWLNLNGSYVSTYPLYANGKTVGFVHRELPADLIYGPQPLYNKLLPYRMILAAAAFFFIVYVLAFPIRNNFRKIYDGIEEIASGNLSADPDVESKDELGRLSTLLRNMGLSLKHARDKERRLDLAKNQLIAGVSHDLRSPLTSILGYTELLLEDKNSITPIQDEYLCTINAKAQKVKRLVDDLFRFTKLRLGDISLNKSDMDLVAFVGQLISEFELDFSKKGMELRFVAFEPHIQANIDGNLLGRAIENLLINAYQHADGATQVGVEVRLVADPAGKPSRHSAEISVSDNGKGIPEDEIYFVFDRFYHGKTTAANEDESGGLGLAITREIVELHKGSVSLSSIPNERTEFTISIPLSSET